MRTANTISYEYKRTLQQTKAIVFLSTPHSGAGTATLASYLGFFLRPSSAVEELAAHDSRLRELNLWYRNNYDTLGLASRVFFETRKTGLVLLVNQTSADPGIAGVTPIPIDADHFSICKPVTATHIAVLQTTKLINEAIPIINVPSLDLVVPNELQQATRAFLTAKDADDISRARHLLGSYIKENPDDVNAKILLEKMERAVRFERAKTRDHYMKIETKPVVYSARKSRWSTIAMLSSLLAAGVSVYFLIRLLASFF